MFNVSVYLQIGHIFMIIVLFSLHVKYKAEVTQRLPGFLQDTSFCDALDLWW